MLKYRVLLLNLKQINLKQINFKAIRPFKLLEATCNPLYQGLGLGRYGRYTAVPLVKFHSKRMSGRLVFIWQRLMFSSYSLVRWMGLSTKSYRSGFLPWVSAKTIYHKFLLASLHGFAALQTKPYNLRFRKISPALNGVVYLIAVYRYNTYYTRTTRIKKWLKKKYTRTLIR